MSNKMSTVYYFLVNIPIFIQCLLKKCWWQFQESSSEDDDSDDSDESEDDSDESEIVQENKQWV